MAVSVQKDIDISASVMEIMEVIADIDSLPNWSSAHSEAKVLESDSEGWPVLVHEKIAQFGVKDEMTLRYEWYEGEVSWELVEPSSAQKRQE
uniref:SRPBCC family protein n=1 Tax=Dietzia sp. TaxID=1871616 RepID=UPI002FD979C2